MHEEHGGRQHQPESLAEATKVIELPPYLGGGAGLLTPADVRKKVFATVRLREGYDLAQVDTFLDQVEATLSSVLRENAVLKARLDAPRQPPSQSGESASHIVGLAQEAADRAIAMAEQEAGRIVADARDRAEDTRREADGYATRLREGLEGQLGLLRNLLAELQTQYGAHR